MTTINARTVIKKDSKIRIWKLHQKNLMMQARLYLARRHPRQALQGIGQAGVTLLEEHGVTASHIPKRIWMYWEQGSQPPFVTACINRIRLFNPEFDVRVLQKDDLEHELGTVPEAVWQLNVQQRSDWIRLQLLQRHGGIWIDASCIVNESMDWALELQQRHGADFVGFRRSLATQDSSYPIIDNWFMAVPKGSRFIADWSKEFDHAILHKGHIAYVDAIKASGSAQTILQKIHDPYYLAMHVAGQVSLRRHTQGPIHLIEAESSAFFFQTQSRWNRTHLHIQLLMRQEPSTWPAFIKLTSGDRRYLDHYISRRIYMADSIIGRLMNALGPDVAASNGVQHARAKMA